MGYRTQYDDTLRIAGIHADGSPWFESDLNAGHIGNSNYGFEVGYAICPDAYGGLWVAHASTVTGFMEYYRFNAAGEQVQFVHSSASTTPVGSSGIDLFPDQQRGIYNNSYNDRSPVAVRVDSSGNLPWPDNPFGVGNRASRPMLTEDGGIMWAFNVRSDVVAIRRLTREGLPYYEETEHVCWFSVNRTTGLFSLIG
jgi:hypothetical protein